MFKHNGWIFLIIVLLSGVGCGPAGQFSRARKVEGKKKYYDAWIRYQTFAADYPSHKLAPQALFRAGLVAKLHLKDCYMAQTFFERVVERYPQSEPWARAASLEKVNCPDYFPLIPGSQWVEGDSDTKGKNARVEIICENVSGPKKGLPSEYGRLVRAYFAGKKKSHATQYVYKKVGSELWEFSSESDPRYKVVLRWPFEPGLRWKTKMRGRTFRYEIKSISKKVKVVAGTFSECLHVRSSIEGIPGAFTNEYYAPGVGRVLTTVTTKNAEKRVTELLSFDLAPWPEIKKEREEI